MKQFLKTHQEWVLIACALAISGVIIGFYVWGIALVAENVGAAIEPPQGNVSATQFNIQGAQQLNLP
jgi:hypothetical protein